MSKPQFRDIRKEQDTTHIGYRLPRIGRNGVLEEPAAVLSNRVNDSLVSLRALSRQFIERYGEEMLAKFEKVFPDKYFSAESIKDLAAGGSGNVETKWSTDITASGLDRKINYLGTALSYLLEFDSVKTVSKLLDILDVPNWPETTGSPARTANFYVSITTGTIGDVLYEIEKRRLEQVEEVNPRKQKREERMQRQAELMETIKGNELLLSLFELMGSKMVYEIFREQDERVMKLLNNPVLCLEIISLGRTISGVYIRSESYMKKSRNLSTRYGFTSKTFMTAINARDFWKGKISQEELEERYSANGLDITSISRESITTRSQRSSLTQTFFSDGVDNTIKAAWLKMRECVLEVADIVKKKYEAWSGMQVGN
ncbi:hypothetical protein KKB44_02595 [Candidatus Micrarchaeota archaeon]|nr:hypothetical protein [Candidatus Micrarchaeota archaeon]